MRLEKTQEKPMRIKTIDITVAQEPRGNRHGYTGSDYARDAAVEIERDLSAQGLRSWPSDEADVEASARRAAESMIAECDESFRPLLGIEITVDLRDVDHGASLLHRPAFAGDLPRKIFA
jgi:hypothetical protein